MPETLNGKPRVKHACEVCGLVFKTCGPVTTCPRCSNWVEDFKMLRHDGSQILLGYQMTIRVGC